MANAPRRYLLLTAGEIGFDTPFYSYTENDGYPLDISIEFTTLRGDYHANPCILINNINENVAQNLPGKLVNIFAGYINSDLGYGLIGRGTCLTTYRQPLDIGTQTEIWLLDNFDKQITFQWSPDKGNLDVLLDKIFADIGLTYLPINIFGVSTKKVAFKGSFERLLSYLQSTYGIEIIQRSTGEITAVYGDYRFASTQIAKVIKTSNGMIRVPTASSPAQCFVSTIIRPDISPGDLVYIESERFILDIDGRGVWGQTTTTTLGLQEGTNKGFQGVGLWMVISIVYNIQISLDSSGVFEMTLECVRQAS